MTRAFAFLFPGQGSQSVGMLSELAAEHPVVRDTFSESSDALGFDLWALAQDGPADKQKDTRNTQQLMLASGVACARVWQAQDGPAPVAMAGHSVGEFAAMVASDALSFVDAVNLVKQRAELMADAVADGVGGMAAVLGLDDDKVVAVCAEAVQQMTASGDATGPVVEAVNFNAPGQVVISGHLSAIEVASGLAKAAGARKVMPVPVSVPNHSALMRPAGEKLMPAIDALDWHLPAVPVVQNVAATLPADVGEMLESLKVHVFSPVRWTQSMATLVEQKGVELFIELGPGKVLTGMGKRIDKTRPVYPVFDSGTLASALADARVSDTAQQDA